ncbi:MAG: hypothetical protein P8N02_18670 [Actinomycetota bacterium]|jgi:hypothetical protein|nr:hypothetical protein [Actinomycetota bacterium]
MPASPRPELSLRAVGLLTATVVAAGSLSLAVINLPSGDDSTVDLTAQQASAAAPQELVVDVTVPLYAPGEEPPVAQEGVAASDAAASSGQVTAGAVKGVGGTAPAPAPAAKTPNTGPALAHPDSPAVVAPAVPDPTGPAAPAPVVPATTYEYFSFPGVAPTVIIALHDGNRMEFWSVTPASGWGFFVEKETGNLIEIGFETTSGPEQEGEFVARLVSGKISVSHYMESEDGGDDDHVDDGHDEEDDDESDD